MNVRELQASILELTSQRGFQSEMAQVRAKAVLTELVPELPHVSWTYNATRLIRNLSAALVTL